MSFSFHDMTVPVFVHTLRNLAHILEKGRADAEGRALEPAVLMAAQLAPDMLALPRQVQIACDTVKNAAGRLAGVDLPSYEDTETSFEELQARVAKTIAFVEGIDGARFEGAEDRRITLKFPGRELEFSGADYLTKFVLPNVYFHVTMTYALLRHNGVPLGKTDYMGA